MATVDPQKLLQEVFAADAEKYFDEPAGVALFDAPLVGVARADDAWFARFKEVIGQFYWTPQEALALVAPGATARSVISWSLPISAVARRANRKESRMPARPWAYVRTFGEEFGKRLRHGLAERLRQMGYAVAEPGGMKENKVESRPGAGISACWSERHTAFVAGLGTFGLSGGLITRRGIAHRLGSVVTDAGLEPTPRPYGDDPFAWCLRTSAGTSAAPVRAPNGAERGKCGACIKRCPAGSVGESVAARNKDACRAYAYDFVSKRGRVLFGWEGTYGCGLCQTGVPCEERNPTEKQSP